MRRSIMLPSSMVAAVVFLLVLALSPHNFALAWAEAWIGAFVTMIVFALVVWHKHERRN